MKIMTLAFITVIAATSVHSAIAQGGGDMMPPPGPYRSTGEGMLNNPNWNPQTSPQPRDNRGYPSMDSSQLNNEMLEMIKQRQAQMEQRQAQMEQWMKQSNRPAPQMGSNRQPPQWNYNQRPPMMNPYHGSGVNPNYPDNRLPQGFSSRRGPVYGPGVPPQEFYRQGNQPMPRFQNN